MAPNTLRTIKINLNFHLSNSEAAIKALIKAICGAEDIELTKITRRRQRDIWMAKLPGIYTIHNKKLIALDVGSYTPEGARQALIDKILGFGNGAMLVNEHGEPLYQLQIVSSSKIKDMEAPLVFNPTYYKRLARRSGPEQALGVLAKDLGVKLNLRGPKVKSKKAQAASKKKGLPHPIFTAGFKPAVSLWKNDVSAHKYTATGKTAKHAAAALLKQFVSGDVALAVHPDASLKLGKTNTRKFKIIEHLVSLNRAYLESVVKTEGPKAAVEMILEFVKAKKGVFESPPPRTKKYLCSIRTPDFRRVQVDGNVEEAAKAAGWNSFRDYSFGLLRQGCSLTDCARMVHLRSLRCRDRDHQSAYHKWLQHLFNSTHQTVFATRYYPDKFFREKLIIFDFDARPPKPKQAPIQPEPRAQQSPETQSEIQPPTDAIAKNGLINRPVDQLIF